MKKIMTLAAIAMSFTLGLSADKHDNVVTRQLSDETQQEFQQELQQNREKVRAQKTSMVGQEGPRTLAIGQKTEIKLGSTPSTGYSWRLASCDPENALEQDKQASSYEKKSGGLFGAEGIQTITLTAKQAGKATCTFESVRPWEKESSDSKNIKTKKYSFIISE